MDQQQYQLFANGIKRHFVYQAIARHKTGNKPAILKMALIALVLSGHVYAGDTTRHYQIPAQSLNNALMRFAADSNLELVFTADQVRGMTANRLEGDMTAAQALTQLLQGSGMTYRYINAHSITLEQQPGSFRKTATAPENPEPQSSSEQGQIMPKVTVEADAEQAYDPEYYADPYNKDYVIPNATAGTKTDTPIMETPLNVQVISKQVLKEQQAFTLADALKNISGVRTSFGGDLRNNQSIFLRGFDSNTFFRDGFRLTQGSASREFANVESVEVLKGSSAILYGLVEPGGMVNVITKKPLATPYYGFSQQFGSYDLYRTTLDATGPITQNKDLLYRVNLSYENNATFRDLTGKENVFFAPVLQWNISPHTQATFELEYNHAHQGMDTGSILPIIDGQLLRVPRSRNYGEYTPLTTETIFGSFNWSHQFNDDWSVKHRFSVNQRLQTTPYSTSILAVGPSNFFGLFDIPANQVSRFVDAQAGSTQNNTYATNLDVTGHFDTGFLKHTLLLGGDYYRLDDGRRSENGLGPVPGSDGLFHLDSFSQIDLFHPVHPGSPANLGFSPGFSQNTTTDQYGLYIQDQIKLPYDVHVTGGIRYQYIHQKQGTTFFDGVTPPDLSVQTQDAVTPRAGILWQPKKWLSLYANYTESFGANTAQTFVRPGLSKAIDPTSAEQYEGGLKFEAFDGKLRATLAYFDLTKTNVAVADPSHPAPACGINGCSIAVGEIRSRGPELDIQGEILPGWNVIGNWTNLDIRVTKGISANSSVSPTPGSTAGGNVGDRLFGQPRNTGKLWSTYTLQDSDFKGLQFGGGLNFVERTYTGDPKYPNPGYITVDLMGGYSRKVGDVTLSAQLNVTNLLDKYYTTDLFPAFGAPNTAFVTFGTPRTFMGQVSVQY